MESAVTLGPPTSKPGSCDEKAPDSSDNTTPARSVGWPKGKKRKKVSKDAGDPHKPLSSYHWFVKEHRERVKNENPDFTFTDITKKIAQDWRSLSAKDKKQFEEAAEEDKDRYARELAAYKKTESCRNFASREKKRVKEGNTEDGSGFDIPIFTEEFLDHNKIREAELRQLRKSNTDYEQQNAALEKMIENTHAAIAKLEDETLQQKCHNQALLRHLEQMRTTLTEAFSHLNLPGEKEGPKLSTIDSYMSKLSDVLDSQSTSSAWSARVRKILATVDLHG